MAQWIYKGANGPIQRGYAVTRSRWSPETKGANATLLNPNGDQISLWVTDVSADFQLSGVTAQSVLKRDFYPHNFVQPTIVVSGQCANSYQYQYLAEFIRDAQRKGVLFGDHDSVSKPTMTLHIKAGGWRATRNSKGQHRPILAEGYVQQVKRGGKQGEFAPEYQFNFLISRMLSGIITDEAVNARHLKSWADIIGKSASDVLAERGDFTYVTDPDDPLDPGTNSLLAQSLAAIQALQQAGF